MDGMDVYIYIYMYNRTSMMPYSKIVCINYACKMTNSRKTK